MRFLTGRHVWDKVCHLAPFLLILFFISQYKNIYFKFTLLQAGSEILVGICVRGVLEV